MTRQLVRAARIAAMVAALAALAAPVAAFAFTYQPAGTLKSGSGTGHKTSTNWAPGMRFPIKDAPAYLNSQVYGNGGVYGPGGGQCDKANFSYPWWDNYCEKRSWTMPLCPSGKGHQGQDMRATTCEKNKWWTVATVSGTITSIGTYSVYLKGNDGRTHRYLHLQKASLQVKVGSKVSKGQLIGKVSNEFGGTPTSVHLHFDLIASVSGIGTTYVSPYNALVESYKALIGQVTPTCDAAACAAKSSCGAWSACGGFSDACDESGSRSRTCTTYACSAGTCKSSSKTETGACSRDTDGKQVKPWSSWGACAGFDDACDSSGSQERSREVCKAGKAAPEQQQQACTVSTDGKQLQPWGAWGVCAGFGSICGEVGSQQRSRSVCKGDAPSTETESRACEIDKDGIETEPYGPWSVCLHGEDPCKGVRTRKRKICKAGAEVAQSQSEPCQGAGCGGGSVAAGDAAGDEDTAVAADAASVDDRDTTTSGDGGVVGPDAAAGADAGAFVPPPASPSGCQASPTRGAAPTGGALALLAILLLATLRRRSEKIPCAGPDTRAP